MNPRAYLEPLEVSSVRASGKAAFTKTNISKTEIAKINLGQDIPFILNQTPSLHTTTDAGNGVRLYRHPHSGYRCQRVSMLH
jgi:iron complex outermembrane receptor protein